MDSVLVQRETSSFKIDEILVVSDGGTDVTPSVVKRYCKVSSEVRLYHDDVRRGKGHALNVIPENEWVVYGLVEPFLTDESVRLVGGLPVPLPPENLVEMAGFFSFRIQKFIKEHMKKGSNLYAAHGCVLALSSRLARKISVPSIPADDAYLYLKCIGMGYKFVYVGDRAKSPL